MYQGERGSCADDRLALFSMQEIHELLGPAVTAPLGTTDDQIHELVVAACAT